MPIPVLFLVWLKVYRLVGLLIWPGPILRSSLFPWLGFQHLLDAFYAMIPKVDGDSTPSGQRPLCVLPVIYRLWASLRLTHLNDWFQGWIPQSVFSLGNG